MKLGELAALISAQLVGDPLIEITGVAPIETAGSKELTSLHNRRYLKFLATTQAAAIIIEPALKDSEYAVGKNLLLCANTNRAFAMVIAAFAPPDIKYERGIHPSAIIAPDAEVSHTASIGPLCVVQSGARIGDGTVLMANVYVGHQTTVGANCIFYPGAIVCERCTIGDRVVLHPCSVVGSQGFGFEPTGGLPRKIPQIGTVVLEDDVEIGACSCVDRARFASTVIKSGTKIDNLCQVAHNVQIGKNCLLAAHTGLAGTVKLGDGVMMGGQSGAADHIEIGDGAILYARTGATKDIPPGAIVSGLPPLPRDEDLKQQVNIRRIPKLLAQIRELEERIVALEAQIKDYPKKG